MGLRQLWDGPVVAKGAAGTLGGGQGDGSGDFGVVRAAAKQAALGWPGEEEILVLFRQWGRGLLVALGWLDGSPAIR